MFNLLHQEIFYLLIPISYVQNLGGRFNLNYVSTVIQNWTLHVT